MKNVNTSEKVVYTQEINPRKKMNLNHYSEDIRFYSQEMLLGFLIERLRAVACGIHACDMLKVTFEATFCLTERCQSAL